MSKLTKVYIASPYSYKGKYPLLLGHITRWKRFFQVLYYQALIDSTYKVQCFGPILESHLVVFAGKLCKLAIGKSSGVWADFREGDLAMVEAMDEVYVIMLDGWDESTGVRSEIRYAKSINKPVRYFDTVNKVLRDTPKGEILTNNLRKEVTNVRPDNTNTPRVSEVHRTSATDGSKKVRSQ